MPTFKGVSVDGTRYKLDYAEIENRPTIPSATSDLTNDSGFIGADNVGDGLSYEGGELSADTDAIAADMFGSGGAISYEDGYVTIDVAQLVSLLVGDGGRGVSSGDEYSPLAFDVSGVAGAGLSDDGNGSLSVSLGNGLSVDDNDAVAVDVSAIAGTGLYASSGSGDDVLSVDASELAGYGLTEYDGQLVVDPEGIAGMIDGVSNGDGYCYVDTEELADGMAGYGLTNSHGRIDVDIDYIRQQLGL